MKIYTRVVKKDKENFTILFDAEEKQWIRVTTCCKAYVSIHADDGECYCKKCFKTVSPSILCEPEFY